MADIRIIPSLGAINVTGSADFRGTGASSVLFVSGSGNVGVGTTNPASKFHVAGAVKATATTGHVFGTSTDTSRALSILNSNLADASSHAITLGYGASNNNQAELSFYLVGTGSASNRLSLGLYNSSDTVNILGSGDVGIGVTNPGVKLQVASGVIRATGNSSTTGQIDASPNYGAFRFYDGSSFLGGLGTGQWASVAGSGDTIMYLATNRAFHVSNTTTPRFTVASSGKVGIGTTDPYAPVHIKVAGTPPASGQQGLYGNLVLEGDADKWNRLRFDTAGTGSWGVAVNTSRQFAISRLDSSFSGTPDDDNFVIDTTGNVGIQTSSPSYLLTVNGPIYGTAIRIDSGGSNSIRIGDDFGSGGTATIHNYQSDLYLQYNNGSASSYVRFGGGNTGVTLVDSQNGNYQVGTAATASYFGYISGNVGIGTNNPGTKFHVVGDARINGTIYSGDGSISTNNSLQLIYSATSGVGTISAKSTGGNTTLALQTANSGTTADRLYIGSNGAIKFNNYGSGNNTGTAAYNLSVDSSGNIIETANPSLTGTGTTNYVTKWSGTNTLTDSVMYDDGTNIGVGESSPSYKLHVGGTFRASGLGTFGGSVGIGLTNPSYALHVNGGAASRSDVQVTYNALGTTISDGAQFGIQSAGAYIWNFEDSPIYFGTNNTRRVTFDAGGNVGIGISTPTAKLDVYKSGSLVFNVVGSQGQLFSVTDSLSGSLMSVNDISGVPILEVFSDDRVVAGEFGTNALVVAGANVGIGTSSPTPKLHLVYTGGTYGSDATSGFINQADTGRATMRLRSIEDAPAELFFDVNGAIRWDISARGSSESNALMFFPQASTPSYSVVNNHTFQLSQNGDVIVTGAGSSGRMGIGTTQPSVRLHVVSNQSSAGTLRLQNTSNTGYSNIQFYSASGDFMTSFGYINKGVGTIGGTTLLDLDSGDPLVIRGGSVGIGITNPSYQLDLTTAAQHVARFTSTAANNGGLIINKSNASYNPNIMLQAGGSTKWYLLSDSSDSDKFKLYEATGTSLRFTLTQGGSVGLGTNSPDTELDILANSGTSFKGIKITSGDLSGQTNPILLWLEATGEVGMRYKEIGGAEYFQNTYDGTKMNWKYFNGSIYATRMSLTNAGNLSLVGDMTVDGILRAREFHTTFVSASIIYQSGSTQFGNSADDTHTFTGDIIQNGNYSIKNGTEGNVFLKQTTSEANFWVYQEASSGWGQFVINDNTELTNLGGIHAGSGLSTLLTTTSAVGYNIGSVTGAGSGVYSPIGFNHSTGGAFFAGDVGIGITNPSKKLHIQSSAKDTLFYLQSTNTTTDGYAQIQMQAGSRSAYLWVANQNATSWGGDGSLNIYTTNGAITWWPGQNQKMILTTGGNLGIGTDSPTTKLDVDYDATLTYDPAANQPVAVVANRNNSNTNNQVATLGLHATGWQGVTTGVINLNAIQSNGNESTADFSIQTRNAGTYAEKVRLTAAGNMGIGVSAPTAKLHTSPGNWASDPGAKNYSGAAINTSGSDIATGRVYFQGYSQGATDVVGINNETDRLVLYNYTDTRYLQIWDHAGSSYLAPAAGNVGIGTTASSRKLTVYSTENGNYSTYIYHGGATSNSYGLFIEAGTNATDAALRVRSKAGDDYFEVQGDGNVGIGTASPVAKLGIVGGVNVDANGVGNTVHVWDDAVDGQPGFIVTNTGTQSSSTHTLYLKNYGSGVSANVFGTTIASKSIVASADGGEGLLLGTLSNKNIFIGTNAAFAMVVDNNQQVGIGTTSPAAYLQVGTPGSSLTKDLLLVKGGGGSGNYGFRVQANNADELFLVDTYTYNTTIPYAGEVYGRLGIGVTAPQAKLHVAGTALFEKGITVETDPAIHSGSNWYSLTDSHNIVRITDGRELYIEKEAGAAGYSYFVVSPEEVGLNFDISFRLSGGVPTSYRHLGIAIGNDGSNTVANFDHIVFRNNPSLPSSNQIRIDVAGSTEQSLVNASVPDFFDGTERHVLIQVRNNQYVVEVDGVVEHTFTASARTNSRGLVGFSIYEAAAADTWVKIRDFAITQHSDNRTILAGNVGIGLRNPAELLHIYGGASGYGSNVRIDSTNEYGGLSIFEAGSLRGTVAYGNAGNILTGAGSNSLSIRSENALHLAGSGDSLTATVVSGKVGIGTTDPLTKLHVSSVSVNPAAAAIQGDSKLVVSGVDGNIDLFSQDDNSTVSNAIGMGRYHATTGALIHKFGLVTWAATGNQGSNAGDRIAFHYGTGADTWGSTELMSIAATGNVGIGSTVPGYKLDVSAAARVHGVRMGRDFSISDRATVRLDSYGDKPADILFGQSTAANQTSWDGVYWGISSRDSGAGASQGNKFTIWRASAHAAPNNSENQFLTITPDLNMGIGTASPTNALHIKKEGYQLKLEDGNTTNTAEFVASNNTLGIYSDRANTVANSDMLFSIDNSTKMYISGSGNVGINTTSPLQMLHVESGSMLLSRALGDADYDAINIAYRGSWSNYTNKLAGINVTDSNTLSQTVGRFGVTYNGSVGTFVVTDLYSGGYGASGDVLRAGGNGTISFPQYGAGYLKTDANGAISTTTQFTGSFLGNLDGNASTATNVAWTGVTAGRRTNYTLGFEAPSTGYAGFSFTTPGGSAENAGYLLIRGGADNDVYTTNGITLVADQGWLTLAQRVQTNKGIRFMTGGTSTTKMTITNAGDVGINTTSPSAKLQVKGAGGTTGITFQTTDSSNNQNFYVLDGGRAGIQYYPFMIAHSSSVAPTGLPYLQVATNALYVSQSGYVGIGTSGPSDKLDVRGTVRFYGDSNFGPGSLNLTDVTSGGNTYGIYSGYPALGDFTIRESGVANHLIIKQTTGYTGIGTSSPAAKLHVSGSILAGDISGAQTQNNITIYHGGGNLADGTVRSYFELTNPSAPYVNTDDTWNWKIATVARPGTSGNYNSHLEILRTTRSGVTNDTVMAFSRTGNVGIGTTSPSAKLEVAGDVMRRGTLLNPGSIQVGTNNYSLLYHWTVDEGAIGTNTQVRTNTNPYSAPTVTAMGRSTSLSSGAASIVIPNNRKYRKIYGYFRLRSQGSTDGWVNSSAAISSDQFMDGVAITGFDSAGSNETWLWGIVTNNYDGNEYVANKPSFVGNNYQKWLTTHGVNGSSYWDYWQNYNDPSGNTPVKAFYFEREISSDLDGDIEIRIMSDQSSANNEDTGIEEFAIYVAPENETDFDDVTQTGIGTRNPAAKLDVYQSGSLVFNVAGSQGQLFSVTDSLSGSLMSVNDISGVPILEVFSDDKVVAGEFGTNALVVKGANVGAGTDTPFATATNNKGLNINTGGHSSLLIGDGVNYGGMIQSSDDSQRIIIGANVYDSPTSSWSRFTGDSAALIDVYGEGSSAFISFNVDAGSSGYPTSRMMIKNNGSVGIGTDSPDTILNVVHTNLSAEPYTGITVKNTSNTGAAYTGLAIDSQYQSHVRYMINGSLKWQSRVGRGIGTDAFDIYSWTAGANVFSILNNGNVGISSTSPAYKLDVAGTIRATGDVIAYSDRRVKQDIVTLENSVDLVKKLRGVSYKKIGEDDQKIGVIAQEILEVLPQVVSKDENGMYSVAYGNMAGLFIEAIKEQQHHIESLEDRIQKLEQLLTQKP